MILWKVFNANISTGRLRWWIYATRESTFPCHFIQAPQDNAPNKIHLSLTFKMIGGPPWEKKRLNVLVSLVLGQQEKWPACHGGCWSLGPLHFLQGLLVHVQNKETALPENTVVNLKLWRNVLKMFEIRTYLPGFEALTIGHRGVKIIAVLRWKAKIVKCYGGFAWLPCAKLCFK